MHFTVIRHSPFPFLLLKKPTFLLMAVWLLLGIQKVVTANDELSFSDMEIQVERFIVEGRNPFPIKKTKAILENYLGEHQGIEGIEAAADDLQVALKKAGFPFYRVRIPSQPLKTGTIQLDIVTLPIGTVEVRGNKHFSQQNILNTMPTLHQGAATIERQVIKRGLALANRHRSKRARLTFNVDDTQEQLNAIIEVKDYKPMELIFSARNTGDEGTGEYRTGITFKHNNVFDRDHGLSMNYVVSPDDASNVKQYDVSYRLPLYRLGDEMNFTTWRSNSSSTADLNGAGKIDSISYSHFFDNSQDYQHQVDVSVQDKFFNNDITPNDNTSNNDVRSRPLEIRYKGRFNTKNTDTDFFLGYRKNLSGGNKNDQRFYELARIGAVQSWSAVTAGASVDFWLPKQWLFRASIDGQLSNDSLISGEQFGFGGSASLLGFEEWEVTGDEGYQTMLELKTPPLYKRLQLFGRYEMGHIKRQVTLTGQANSEVASSLGLGLLTPIGKKCSLKLQAGYVLDGVGDVFEGDSRTRDGDSKAHVDLSCNVL